MDISKCHDQNCYIARNPISFSGKSYSQYRIINKKSIEDQLSLSLRVRTVQPTGEYLIILFVLSVRYGREKDIALFLKFYRDWLNILVNLSAKNTH